MKFFSYIFFILIFTINNIHASDIGETEITAEDGIEVFQKEKYYLLKNNVEIISKNFNLNADLVKAYFDKDLYDITNLYAEGKVILNSKNKKISAKGNILEFTLKEEKIKIKGKNSELNLNETNLFSDGMIEVNNKNGNFLLNGKNSKLYNKNITVTGSDIKGKFTSIENKKEIIELNVEDEKLANIKTDDIDMYSSKAFYDKEINIIELIEKVKVIRGKEIITGDYGYVDITKNSYKVTSNNSKKVKVLISNNNE